MKNCSAMLCTRMWSKGITHSLPKFAASFKASTSYTKWGYIRVTHRKTDEVTEKTKVLADSLSCFTVQ